MGRRKEEIENLDEIVKSVNTPPDIAESCVGLTCRLHKDWTPDYEIWPKTLPRDALLQVIDEGPDGEIAEGEVLVEPVSTAGASFVIQLDALDFFDEEETRWLDDCLPGGEDVFPGWTKDEREITEEADEHSGGELTELLFSAAVRLLASKTVKLPKPTARNGKQRGAAIGKAVELASEIYEESRLAAKKLIKNNVLRSKVGLEEK